MKTMRSWTLVATAIITVLMPLHNASAWDYSRGGYRGGGYHGGGYHGGHRGGGYYGGGYYGGGYYGGGYYGGYRGGGYYGGGCRGCGAAIVGLAIGTIIGSAMVEASRPPVVIRSPTLPPPGRCASVIVDGETYYNCNDDRGVDYDVW